MDELEEKENSTEGISEVAEEVAEKKRIFSIRQIIYLVLIGVSSFVFFFIVFFPLSDLAKNIILSSFAKQGVFIELENLNVSLLGEIETGKFSIDLTKTTNLKGSTLNLQIKPFSLINKKVDANLLLTSAKLFEDNEEILFLRSVFVNLQMNNYEKKITDWDGKLRLEITGGKVKQFPELPIIGKLENFELKKSKFQFSITSGKMLIEEAVIDSSILKIIFTGNINLSRNLGFSKLDLNACIELKPVFAQEREDLKNWLIQIEDADGKACVPLKGTLKSPKPELEKLL